MNKAKLKAYAPQARKDFIAAVSARANQLGISDKSIAPAEKRGDILIVEGREWPAGIGPLRDRLIKRIDKEGYAQTMEAVAYTWFNRIAALRYMEIHDYLGHGHRVLSSRDGGLPEVLPHAAELGLPGLDAAKAQEMQLAGNRDGELYRLILVAQCNALSNAMSFLFERIDDETELLLPDNLLRTDSIIAKLVEAIPEEDWQQVEIIGWLYQFYISEKKDEVIGKVVKSEDIPAATQLFTPNWIVQYLVQNSVGRLWLMANPMSTLKSQWPYYIEPAEQTPEVQAQLDALIQTRMAEDGGSLNPETITVLDPACGSGHILVEAYEVLKAIYLERGYQPRSIPRLILEKNLYGLDIDDRAAQLAGFALLMKARADDRRLFTEHPKPNVLSLQGSDDIDVDDASTHLLPYKVSRSTVEQIIGISSMAKTIGSLMDIPDNLISLLPSLEESLHRAHLSGDVFCVGVAENLLPIVKQANILAKKYDVVVANPPYMTSDYFPASLKKFVEDRLSIKRTDLYALLLDRATGFASEIGIISFVTRDSWMFLPTYEVQRYRLLERSTILSLVHLGAGAFDTISGQVVQTVMFSLLNTPLPEHKGRYIRVFEGDSESKKKLLLTSDAPTFTVNQQHFSKLPSSPLAYGISDDLWRCFELGKPIGEYAELREGIHTGKNEWFMRLWWEISFRDFSSSERSDKSIDSNKKKWIPYSKGGAFRKWYGNNDFVISFDQASRDRMAQLKGHVRPSQSLYFKEGGTWTDVGSGSFGVRYFPAGFLFDGKGMVIVGKNIQYLIAMMNSKPFQTMANTLMPTLNYKCGTVRKVPYADAPSKERISVVAIEAIELALNDWAGFETSWEFEYLPFLELGKSFESISKQWHALSKLYQKRIENMRALERENNEYFIAAYGLNADLTAEPGEEQITLTRPNRESDSKCLVSYSIGCMMGRYSLDEPGLIYAHAGNVGFDATRYKTFSADADGIVPLTDELWFEDDAANRIREFLLAVWGVGAVEENEAWLAESLGRKGNETPEETIRRYVAGSFYKDHLQTYKKRPIYWLFSSGKQGAFQCLVYLHRYHEGTLSRMRAEYVVPLTAKMAARIDMMNNDAAAASSAAARTKINKQIEALRKKQTELLAFDERLRHYADMRIQLDLDDGVKVNYGKFGDLLDGVKTITGGAGDD